MKINRNLKSAVPYLSVVLALHIIGFSFLFFGGWQHPVLLGMGLIAYTLGLRHAFDADHIAAIDNIVRKLLEQRQNPTGVGFYFSLGHSSVVFLMAVLLGVAVNWAKAHLTTFQTTGGLIGTLVSGFFLIVIGILNLVILIQLVQLFKKVRREHITSLELNELLDSRGLIMRFVRPLFKFITKSWHVYPLGFLFGLGFDTPIRKIYYNITITSVSVIAALFIGVLEILQLIGEKQHWTTGFGGWLTQINTSWLGYGLVIVFILAWLISMTIWKVFDIEGKGVK